MYERVITDEEFLISFLELGFAARPAISHLLVEKLSDDVNLREGDVKAIIIQIMENYFFQTEILVMLLMAIKEKKLHPGNSLAAIYNRIFVREGRAGQFSEPLLEEIRELDEYGLIEVLGLADPRNIFDELDSNKMNSLVNCFGSKEQAIAQGMKEITDLKNTLSKIIANRIETKTGLKFPFFKLLNKLKHGYQVVEDKVESVLSVLIDVVEEDGTKAKFTVIEIPIKKESAYFFADQTELMALAIQHLLRLYSIKNSSK